MDGDGVNDLAVGAYLDDAGGNARGAVHIMFMTTDGSVDYTVEINSSTTNGPTLHDSDKIGSSVANIGDLDGDGVNDLVEGYTALSSTHLTLPTSYSVSFSGIVVSFRKQLPGPSF